jgi:hypothetical protein
MRHLNLWESNRASDGPDPLGQDEDAGDAAKIARLTAYFRA